MTQILGLLGMYFEAVVVEVEKYLPFFRLALAILCRGLFIMKTKKSNDPTQYPFTYKIHSTVWSL